MSLEWRELTAAEAREVANLYQQLQALEDRLAEIARQRGKQEGIWRNRELAIASEITLIKTRLAGIRQPTYTEES